MNLWRGEVVSIHVAAAAKSPMASVREVRAVHGRGLEGDRYFKQTGTYSKPTPDCEVTLIEQETVQALEREHGVKLEPKDPRRNIVTRGVPLNHLVDRKFKIGSVTLHGIRLCEPCQHLASLTNPKVLPGLVHRGGLRAQILTDGIIRVGDTIQEA